MTDQTTDFFDGIGGGSGAPGAVLKNVGDAVHGEIVDMYKRDYIPFGAKEPEKRDDGSNKQQLVIVLQTNERNWANVNKVPLKDPADPSKGEKAPSEDDGKRAVYVPEGKNIQFAIGRACQAVQSKPVVGGTLGVRIFNLKPTDKGNALKEHQAVYTPPTAGSEFFGQAPSAPAQSAPPAQQAYAQGSSFGGGDHGLTAQPAQQAPAQQAPAPAQPAAAPAADPWASQPTAPAAGDPWATAPAGGGKPAPF